MNLFHFCLFLTATAAMTCSAKDLKVLMVGNSFSQSVMTCLPDIVKANPADHLSLADATVGGCSMENHCKLYAKGLKNPENPKYSTNLKIGKNPILLKKGRYRANLHEILSAEKWDIVTIHQKGRDCVDPKSYVPHADNLIAIIRKHAPQAEIVVQQTWSYNVYFDGYAKRGVNQTSMYEQLKPCYLTLAKKNHFRLIPTGDAVQIYRKYAKVPPIADDLSKYNTPADVPAPVKDVVGGLKFKKDPKTGKVVASGDLVHLNGDGCYLQACVWYMILFDRTAADVKYAPKYISANRAALLKKCAEEAVKNVPKTK